MNLLITRGGDTPLLYISIMGLARLVAVLVLLCTSISLVIAQKQDYIWCFGDSAGLDFNAGIPVPFPSGMQAHEAAASLSDKHGNLLFYVGDRKFSSNYSSIRNSNHQTMFNGDSLLSPGSITNGLMILPFPNDTNKYYVFHRGIMFSIHYLYYSVVDMSLQGGLGAVIQKNVLINGINDPTERIGAIMHGNGRDWWIITRAFGSNQFQLLLVNPQGIASPFNQNIGTNYTNWLSYAGEMATSINGNKIAIVTHAGNIDVFDFDRCSGILSNWMSIGPTTPSLPLNSYYGCEFSPDGNLLYVTTIFSPYSQLLQYNLLSSTPWVPYYIYSNSNDSVSFGQLQRGPDNKIYMTSCNPYFTSTFDSLNMYIGVINDPDSIGLACNFAPYSVYLGGRRSFYSLPNMPNYNLGALAGSPCDTLTGLNQDFENNQSFEIYPNPVTEYFTIRNSSVENSKNEYDIKIFDSSGKLVYKDHKYFPGASIIFRDFPSGLYAVNLTRNGRQWFSKFIKL
jgi:hypothetical protein